MSHINQTSHWNLTFIGTGTEMKNLYIMVTLAIVAASCQRIIVDEGNDISTDGYTVFTVDIEEVELCEGEQYGNRWQDGTRIGVFGSATNVPYYLKRDDAGKVQALFYGSIVKGEEILACCPRLEGMELENGFMPCELPSVQPHLQGALESFMNVSRYSFARLEDGFLHFRYPFGILELQFHFDDAIDIQGLELMSDKAVSGRMFIDGSGIVHPSGIGNEYIRLDFADRQVSTVSEGKYTSFFFVLPPALYEKGELRIRVSATSETFEVKLGQIEVPRVKMNNLSVANVIVETSQLPGFDKETGVLE